MSYIFHEYTTNWNNVSSNSFQIKTAYFPKGPIKYSVIIKVQHPYCPSEVFDSIRYQSNEYMNIKCEHNILT